MRDAAKLEGKLEDLNDSPSEDFARDGLPPVSRKELPGDVLEEAAAEQITIDCLRVSLKTPKK